MIGAQLCVQWKDRGVGDLRFLKDRTSGMIRIVLRQDKTRKVRVNHNLHESLSLRAHPTNERVWIYKATGEARCWRLWCSAA